jgi:hypothetical protein
MKFLLLLTLALIASKYNFIFTVKSRKMHFIFASYLFISILSDQKEKRIVKILKQLD